MTDGFNLDGQLGVALDALSRVELLRREDTTDVQSWGDGLRGKREALAARANGMLKREEWRMGREKQLLGEVEQIEKTYARMSDRRTLPGPDDEEAVLALELTAKRLLRNPFRRHCVAVFDSFGADDKKEDAVARHILAVREIVAARRGADGPPPRYAEQLAAVSRQYRAFALLYLRATMQSATEPKAPRSPRQQLPQLHALLYSRIVETRREWAKAMESCAPNGKLDALLASSAPPVPVVGIRSMTPQTTLPPAGGLPETTLSYQRPNQEYWQRSAALWKKKYATGRDHSVPAAGQSGPPHVVYIQKWARRFLARCEFLRRRNAVAVLQRSIRGACVRVRIVPRLRARRADSARAAQQQLLRRTLAIDGSLLSSAHSYIVNAVHLDYEDQRVTDDLDRFDDTFDHQWREWETQMTSEYLENQPLDVDWVAQADPHGQPLYVNVRTGRTQTENPNMLKVIACRNRQKLKAQKEREERRQQMTNYAQVVVNRQEELSAAFTARLLQDI